MQTPSITALALVAVCGTSWAVPATIPFSPMPVPEPVLVPESSVPGPRTSVNQDGTWFPITPAGSIPSPRRQSAVAYDPVGDRMIVFGGLPYSSETWSLSLGENPTWTAIPTTQLPAPRVGASMIYDPVRHRMLLLFGHDDLEFFNDVWALNLDGTPEWTKLQATNLPPGRTNALVVYDSARDRIVVHGGLAFVPLGDFVQLNLVTNEWSEIATTGAVPLSRWSTVGCYDAQRDRLIEALGSWSSGYALSSEVWSFDFASGQWTQMQPLGTAPARALTDAVFDPPRRRLVFFGGYLLGPAPSDTWSLLVDTPAWVEMLPEGTIPEGRWVHGTIYRTATQEMVIYGGWNGTAFLGSSARLTFPFIDPAGPPVVTVFSPTAGEVGDPVEIAGANLGNVTLVQFNGVAAPIHDTSATLLHTEVPVGATTGPLRLVNPGGEVVTEDDFIVSFRPIITSADPDSGKPKTLVQIHGSYFEGASRVSFGGVSSAEFTVLSDLLIEATVDTQAITGPIFVTTIVGTGQSSFSFQVIPRRFSPTLVSVRDVPGDQGGRVVLRWGASDYDEPAFKGITGYRVWRRAPAADAAAAAPAPRGLDGPEEGGRLAIEYWESLAELPAVFLPGYAYVATTPQDSMESGNPYTAFFVQALTADRFTFYNSNVDSGYSVDNLSPPAPIPFAATYSTFSNALHWTPSRAPDFLEFRLHRGIARDFVPGPQNLIAATRDTGFVDAAGLYYYKLGAVDLHGNSSRYAVVSPDVPTAALASLASIDASADRIRVTWYSGIDLRTAATVYRRTPETGWASVAQVTADGAGYLRYEDTDVIPGRRYGYRLGFRDGTEEVFAGEGWATAETALADAVMIRPNPATDGKLVVEFTLAAPGSARFELFDVLGRRHVVRDLAAVGPGRHSITLNPDRPLAPGVYVLRFSAGGKVHVARSIVLE